MRDTTAELFGEFPRPVAASGLYNPNQFFVHSEKEFDAFFNKVGMKKNTYCSVSYFPPGKPPVTDKVSFDLDSPMKEAAFPDEINDQQKLDRMRSEEKVAEDVLGEVCEDARTLAGYAREKEIPCVGVFSGMGLHIHFLYEPMEGAERNFKSTIYRTAGVLELSTVDYVAKDVSRILRIPNGRRVDVEDSKEIICDIYTVPISREELEDVTPEFLLEISEKPREIDHPSGVLNEIPLYEDYVDSNQDVKVKEIDQDHEVEDAEARFILENRVDMPCIAERAAQRNPDHYPRFALATKLFNLGYGIGEATDFIASLGWVNFDRDMTKKYLRQIYEHGYSRPGCDTMQSQGYCVYPDNPTDCNSFGCPSERCKWR